MRAPGRTPRAAGFALALALASVAFACGGLGDEHAEGDGDAAHAGGANSSGNAADPTTVAEAAQAAHRATAQGGEGAAAGPEAGAAPAQPAGEAAQGGHDAAPAAATPPSAAAGEAPPAGRAGPVSASQAATLAAQAAKTGALPFPTAGAVAAQPTGITAEVTAEVLALRQGVGLRSLVGVILLIFVGWLASILIHWLIRLAQRAGAPRAPWVDNMGALARLLVWAWVVTSIVAGGWRLAPMLTLFAGGVVATGLLIGLLRHFENLSTGIGLALRGRIKVGDQIAVGEHTGMVRAVGLMHLHLRIADGSTVYLPNRLLAREAVAIGRARNSYPLRVRLAGAGAWPPAALETARWIARLSPYRDVNARVSVQTEGADQSVLVVEIQVWSPRLLEAAEKHLRAMLDLHVGGGGARADAGGCADESSPLTRSTGF